MIWYKLTCYAYPQIREVNVIKETAKQLVILTERGREQRVAKNSEYENYFRTKNDAKAFFLVYVDNKVQQEKERHQRGLDMLNDLRGQGEEL